MKKSFLFVVFLLSFFIFVDTVYAAPASLSFEPVAVTAKQGQEVEVNVNLFTGNESIASTDIMILYDKGLLEPVTDKTVNGDIFNAVESKVIVPGKLYLYGMETNQQLTQPAQGTVATITFKALQTGSTQLSFHCDPTVKNTSQIIKSNSDFENIISCTATTTHTINITVDEGSVLGAYSDTYGSIHTFTTIFGVLVAVFTLFIVIRFNRVSRDDI